LVVVNKVVNPKQRERGLIASSVLLLMGLPHVGHDFSVVMGDDVLPCGAYQGQTTAITSNRKHNKARDAD
jgi:hypothetical protein